MQSPSMVSALPIFEDIDDRLFFEHEQSIRKFYRRAFANDPWNETVSDEQLDNVFKQALAPSSVFIGAFDSQNFCVAIAIGIAVGQESPRLPTRFVGSDDVYYLSDICCDPDNQRGGVGSMLLETFEKHCFDIGYRTLVLRTLASCEWLCKLYEDSGYVVQGNYDCPIWRLVDGAMAEQPCARSVFSKTLHPHSHRG